MLSPGTAYLLAYLPARRLGHTARKELVERNAATVDPKLKHAIDFARKALEIEASLVDESDQRLATLARQHSVTAASPPLTTTAAQAAWKAGIAARRAAVSVNLLAQIAHLRNAAPDNADLRAQAEQHARDLKASAAELTSELNATGLPAVMELSDNVAEQISLTSNLTPTTPGGYRELNELVRDVEKFIELKVDALDAAPPPAGSAPSASEWAVRLRPLGARDIKLTAGALEVTIDAEAFLAQGKELVSAAPVRRLKIRNAKGRVGDVMRSPLLATIESLDLDDQGANDEDFIALAKNPAASRLRQLDLRFSPFTERGVDALAASPHLKGLEVANLEPNQLDPVDRLEHYDETNTHYVPTDAGKRLEAKYGPLRWLHRR